jgi:hypothetical protein
VLRDTVGGVFAIRHTRGGQQRSSDQLATVCKREAFVSAVDRHAGYLERRQRLRAETLRLGQRSTSQFTSADSRREPKIVFDSRARACLPTWRMPIEHQRSEPFRRAVHRRSKSGGTGADNHQIVNIKGG